MRESKETDVYTVTHCMLLSCFQGDFFLLILHQLSEGESKERCIYSKLYDVCYVFRASLVALLISLAEMQESKESPV